MKRAAILTISTMITLAGCAVQSPIGNVSVGNPGAFSGGGSLGFGRSQPDTNQGGIGATFGTPGAAGTPNYIDGNVSVSTPPVATTPGATTPGVATPTTPGAATPTTPTNGGIISNGAQSASSIVFFEPNSAALSEASKGILRQQAGILQTLPNKFLIEGHASGGTDSVDRMALGAQRASAVRDYLVSLGIPTARLSIATYGNDRLFCEVSACAHQNRRAVTVVQ